MFAKIATLETRIRDLEVENARLRSGYGLMSVMSERDEALAYAIRLEAELAESKESALQTEIAALEEIAVLKNGMRCAAAELREYAKIADRLDARLAFFQGGTLRDEQGNASCRRHAG